MKTEKQRSKIGLIGLAFPGYNLGEEMCETKLKEMEHLLSSQKDITLHIAKNPVLNEADAFTAGREMAENEVDCILALITTFVPDHVIVKILDKCEVPIFLWAVERELQCISLVCGPLITATLYELKKNYRLAAADINDTSTMAELIDFSKAAMLIKLLRNSQIGYLGGKNNIMYSMTADDYTLKQQLGVTTVTLFPEDLREYVDRVPEKLAVEKWEYIKSKVGEVTAADRDGIASSRYFLAAVKLCEDYNLDSISINCFPHLKSKICLAVAMLNDAGYSSACEGDLHSTILMYMISKLTGKPAFNGDFLRMFTKENDVLFSHCGAGAFSLAECEKCIKLQASIETNDGLAVCYATKAGGTVTLLNMMGARDTFRIGLLNGKSVKTDIQYEGTPLKVNFETPVSKILKNISKTGAGHHWNGAFGDLSNIMELFCEFQNIQLNNLSNQ